MANVAYTKTVIPQYTDFKELKKAAIKKKLARRVQLYLMQQQVQGELDKLNFELFGELRSALPEDVMSIEFEGYQITAQQGSARRSFSTEKLMEESFECPHCDEDVTVPGEVVDASYTLGKEPKPTISVRRVGSNRGTNGDGE